jgi:hypothetical protein
MGHFIPTYPECPETPQSGGWKYHSTHFGTAILMGTLFLQPEEVSKLLDYQGRY